MLLVKEGLSSKHIARELGISPRTVDQHIAAAMETLGAANRTAAVSQLYKMEHEAGQGVPERIFIFRDAPDGQEPPHPVPPPRVPTILPRVGGAENTASRSQRVVWIFRIAIFCVMLNCAVILAILAASEVANTLN